MLEVNATEVTARPRENAGPITTVSGSGFRGNVAGEKSKLSQTDSDLYLVTWTGADDQSNPKNWTDRRRWIITMVICGYTLVSPMSTSIVAPALGIIGLNLNATNDFLLFLILSIFVGAYAFGPFILGPLSEVYGRVIVLQVANLFYLVFNTACGFAQTPTQMIIFRLLAGLGGSAPLSVGGGIIADCWRPEERGRSISIYTLAPLLGPVLGPMVGGYVTEYGNWRWVFWTTSILNSGVQVMGLSILQETYAPVILGRKAQLIREITGNAAWHTKWETANRTFANILKIALVRPFVFLATQPIIQVIALYVAYIYGVIYLVLASYAQLWIKHYHEPISISGLNYTALGVGYILGTQATAHLNDHIYKTLTKRSKKKLGRPEFRLPLLIPSSVLVPAGLLWYGWSAQNQLHWIMPNIGIAIFGIGVKIATQCSQMYAIDTYTLYAASAGAAGTFLRSAAGFSFPLFAPAMYAQLGYGWGNSVLALIAVVLGCPAPFLLWKFGPWLRARSTYAANEDSEP